MFATLFIISIALSASVAAQSPVVVCVAGQCLQGFSNTTIGAKLSASGAPTSVLLLPGQYSATTNPELLHNLLTSSSAKLSPSSGFENSSSSLSLPLNVAFQPGLAIYPQPLYAGQSSFSQLPSTPASNQSTPLSAGSLALSANVWVAINSGSNRIILWDSIPDISQLPSSNSQSSLSILDIQSSSCSPPCTGSGICSASGQCTCAPNFTGSSCESCSSGFFGPTCQKCPDGCTTCDEGISGSGRCLVPAVNNKPDSCNCLNGVCGGNGGCTCNTGWTNADNGTACAKCSNGFFLTNGGDCQVCQLGCQQCADGSGNCVSCKSGFTQDANDRTKCNPVQQTAPGGTVCPDGSFSNGQACTPCSPSCKTCSGGTSNDCVVCANGQFTLNGACVGTNGDGVCDGSNMIADNNKHECDSCGAKCTSCKIPNFNVASTINQLQCTGCLPGFVLSEGKCVASCPSGSFLSTQDKLNCNKCDTSCGTCAGDAKFCLTCANNQLASGGKCVTSCPSNTVSSSGSCLPCHPDCATCSGTSFNQCLSCPPERPVLTNGRCLPTCSKGQFFDKTSSSCQSCDGSCSSCLGSGATNCLACAQSSQVLKGGSCVSASCNGTSSVIPGLGVCLSTLVSVPPPTGTGNPAPLPSISGLTSPTPQPTRRRLEWWEILLMALGCAFIFMVILMLWRRRARKQRAKRTAQFANAKALDQKHNWRWKLVRFGEKLFGHNASKPAGIGGDSEEIRLLKLRNAEEARHHQEMEKLQLFGDYQYSQHSLSRAGSTSSRAPSAQPSLHSHRSQTSAPSIYSQVTGQPRRIPEPRIPVRKNDIRKSSRFSQSTIGSSAWSSRSRTKEVLPPPPLPTEAEVYAARHRDPEIANNVSNSGGGSGTKFGSYWLPIGIGSSKNPFRR